MLNAKGERELAYVVLIDGIEPIPNYDRVEQAIVGGWRIIVQKEQFKVGDPAIYFEIDSRVPSDKECFAFLEKRKYKIKTIKMCGTISQGLLMHAEDFGWRIETDLDGNKFIYDQWGGNKAYYPDDESRFLTQNLGVTYADAEDNKRKAPSIDKYKKMAQRNPRIFKQPWARWMMRRDWGKKVMFFFFGKKKDKKNGWPYWVSKTDEERIENMPWILADKDTKWIATEKIDGTSTTFTMKRGKFGKKEMYVCSRNVCFDTIDKPCYYETNVYWEMAQKYNIFNTLEDILDKYDLDWVTIQGETFGDGIQKNNYKMDTWRDFRAFNLITPDRGRWNSVAMENELSHFNLFSVPIVKYGMTMPDTVEELRDFVRSYHSDIYDGMMEGMVFRSLDGVKSFKCVLPEYLLKYHS